jgi:uncharacterized protein with ParB-like and HNH nuclease domain
MNIRNVRQLVGYGDYEVSVFFGSLLRTIGEYKEMGLQLNPDFQRGHVWTRDQQVDYVEYVLSGGRSGRTLFFNHTMWHSDVTKGEFVCVDGLQRLTALMLFVNDEFKAHGHLYSHFTHKSNLSCIKININNLKTKKEVLRWYLEMNSAGTPHTERELDRVRGMIRKLDMAYMSNEIVRIKEEIGRDM